MTTEPEGDQTVGLGLAMLALLAVTIGGLLLWATSPDTLNTPLGVSVFRDTLFCVLPLGLLGIAALCGLHSLRHGGR